MNGFPERQKAEQFNTEDYQVLVVAGKFKTGVDQPLFYAMSIRRSRDSWVQTLSRLNWTFDGKVGTFVLDFRNDAGDIRAAFEPWYGKTVAPPTELILLYDTRRELDEFDVLRPDEIEKAVELLSCQDPGPSPAVLALRTCFAGLLAHSPVYGFDSPGRDRQDAGCRRTNQRSRR